MSSPLIQTVVRQGEEIGISLAGPGRPSNDTAGEWRLATFAGRLAEISGAQGSAALTFVFRLVLEAQRRQEPVAWISARESAFFPPDVAETGVDLDALAVIRPPDLPGAARATDHLLRSGAFGLLVMDVGPSTGLPLHTQSRLAGLAKQHRTALLCISENDSGRPSLGSLISLRAHTRKSRHDRDLFRCEVQVLKDKRRGPGRRYTEVCRGPDGVC